MLYLTVPREWDRSSQLGIKAPGAREKRVNFRAGEMGRREWHVPLLGLVPILFCLLKNLFQIILGPVQPLWMQQHCETD